MSTITPFADGDERAPATENAGYRWPYLLLTYALLVDVICRSWFRREAAWDLFALIVASGTISMMYQARARNPAHGRALKAVVLACVAAVIAATLAMIL